MREEPRGLPGDQQRGGLSQEHIHPLVGGSERKSERTKEKEKKRRRVERRDKDRPPSLFHLRARNHSIGYVSAPVAACSILGDFQNYFLDKTSHRHRDTPRNRVPLIKGVQAGHDARLDEAEDHVGGILGVGRCLSTGGGDLVAEQAVYHDSACNGGRNSSTIAAAATHNQRGRERGGQEIRKRENRKEKEQRRERISMSTDECKNNTKKMKRKSGKEEKKKEKMNEIDQEEE